MNCLKCGGEVWDNTEKVATGWKGPMFKCKDQSCAWVQWPPKAKKEFPKEPQPEPSVLDTDARAVALYWQCFDEILAGIAKRKLTDMLSPDVIASMVATLFIKRSKV